eukprot:TRINITY_DN10794_c0_g1_i1.p1 TRINITY_DN10794_c0_g1~~TRINITY_DN10794_c0_g1_i1.p1  ORF type:complete len:634 (-),score=89.82 TRINITY_DN10794_c0_g1_i1:1071-2972(-)
MEVGANLLDSFKIKGFITQEEANRLQSEIQEEAKRHRDGRGLESYFPPVVISYATGCRHGKDGTGAGPGLVWTVALQRALFRQGIHSFSGLLIEGGMDWEIFKLRIQHKKQPRCKVLVVVLSKAYFQSKACLDEIYLAACAGVPVLPLRFENAEDLPSPEQWWPFTDGKAEQMLKVDKVIESNILTSNCMPSRGMFINDSSIVENFDDLVKSLREKILEIGTCTVICDVKLNSSSTSTNSVDSSVSSGSLSIQGIVENSHSRSASSRGPYPYSEDPTWSGSSDPDRSGSRRSSPDSVMQDADVFFVCPDAAMDLEVRLQKRAQLNRKGLRVHLAQLESYADLRLQIAKINPAIVHIDVQPGSTLPWRDPLLRGPAPLSEVAKSVVRYLDSPTQEWQTWRGCVLNFGNTDVHVAQDLSAKHPSKLSLVAWNSDPSEEQRQDLFESFYSNFARIKDSLSKKEAFEGAAQDTRYEIGFGEVLVVPEPELLSEGACDVKSQKVHRRKCRLRCTAAFNEDAARENMDKVRRMMRAAGSRNDSSFVEAHLVTEPEVRVLSSNVTEESIRGFESNLSKLSLKTCGIPFTISAMVASVFVLVLSASIGCVSESGMLMPRPQASTLKCHPHGVAWARCASRG